MDSWWEEASLHVVGPCPTDSRRLQAGKWKSSESASKVGGQLKDLAS